MINRNQLKLEIEIKTIVLICQITVYNLRGQNENANVLWKKKWNKCLNFTY